VGPFLSLFPVLGHSWACPVCPSILSLVEGFCGSEEGSSWFLLIGVCVFLVWIAFGVTSRSDGAILGWVLVRIAVGEFRSLGLELLAVREQGVF
jgi:hypothetical protein